MSRVEVKQFACSCSARSEGTASPPKCWSCGDLMYQWGVRFADYAPFEIAAQCADKRTINGGY